MADILSNYLNYFKTADPGQSQNWAGGTLTRNNDGSATYYNPSTGENAVLTSGSNLNDIAAANPSIANEWNSKYGFNPSTSDITDLFNPDAYPTSSSTSTNSSTSNSSNSSSSYSGLGQQNTSQLTSAIIPKLIEIINGYPGAVDEYTDAAVWLANNTARQQYDKTLPAVVEAMSARGLGNSSLMRDAISNSVRGINDTASNTAYNAGMDAAEMRMALPAAMASILDLGKYSTSSSSGSSGSSSESNSVASSLDTSVPYTNLMNFLLNY